MKAFYAVGFIIFLIAFIMMVRASVLRTRPKNKNKKIHILVIATEADRADQLLASLSNKEGYKVHIRGVGEQWTGYDFKLRHTLKFAKKLKPDDILMHLDAYDTYVLAHAREVLDKFYKMDANIVISTETTLAPVPEFENKKNVMENMYPTAPNRFRWINSGTYMGYAGAIVGFLSSMPPNFFCDSPTGDKTEYSDDQRCFHTFFLKEGSKHKVKLDYNQDIFHCMWDVHHYSLSPTRLYSETGSMPCILHGNGPAPQSYGEAVRNFKSRNYG